MWLGKCGTGDASGSLYSFREIRVHCHLLTSGIMTEDVENIVHRMTKILRRNSSKVGGGGNETSMNCLAKECYSTKPDENFETVWII